MASRINVSQFLTPVQVSPNYIGETLRDWSNMLSQQNMAREAARQQAEQFAAEQARLKSQATERLNAERAAAMAEQLAKQEERAYQKSLRDEEAEQKRRKEASSYLQEITSRAMTGASPELLSAMAPMAKSYGLTLKRQKPERPKETEKQVKARREAELWNQLAPVTGEAPVAEPPLPAPVPSSAFDVSYNGEDWGSFDPQKLSGLREKWIGDVMGAAVDMEGDQQFRKVREVAAEVAQKAVADGIIKDPKEALSFADNLANETLKRMQGSRNAMVAGSRGGGGGGGLGSGWETSPNIFVRQMFNDMHRTHDTASLIRKDSELSSTYNALVKNPNALMDNAILGQFARSVSGPGVMSNQDFAFAVGGVGKWEQIKNELSRSGGAGLSPEYRRILAGAIVKIYQGNKQRLEQLVPVYEEAVNSWDGQQRQIARQLVNSTFGSLPWYHRPESSGEGGGEGKAKGSGASGEAKQKKLNSLMQ